MVDCRRVAAAGLSLTPSTGLIAGTPTQSGTSSITAEVTDSSSPAESASESFSIAIAAAGTGTVVNACGTLGNSGTTYLLTANVSSAGSCFSIQASDVTLNLNGHTITYNAASQSAATYAISGVACWDTSNPAVILAAARSITSPCMAGISWKAAEPQQASRIPSAWGKV